MTILTAALVGFLLGSIPFSWMMARLFGGVDLRSVGSGNVGATNVARSVGVAAGVVALLLDGAKGAAAALAGPMVAPAAPVVAATLVAGAAAILGHSFSPFMGFRGGKGVATGAGLFAVLAPWGMLVAGVVFAVVVWAGRMVSLGSVAAAAVLPLAAWLTGAGRGVSLLALGVALLVIARHRANLSRIASGTEPQFGRRDSP